MAALYALLPGQAAASRTVATMPTTTVDAVPRGDVLQFRWADAEDRLDGSIRPVAPQVGEPLHVDLQVGTFEGEVFRGPVTVSLRRATETGSDARTVPFANRGWTTTFSPDEAGRYELDVAFRTTRLKTIRATFEVREAPVPRWLGWTVVGVVGLALLLIGVSMTLRRPKVRGAPAPP